MKIFYYTFNRDQSALGDTGDDLVIIDTERTRPNLIELIQHGLRKGAGDVIRIVVDKDIPLNSPYRTAIEQHGAAVEVIGLTKRPRGRPQAIGPEDNLNEIRRIWNTPYFQREAVRKICSVLGRDVTARTLRRHLGERDFTAMK